MSLVPAFFLSALYIFLLLPFMGLEVGRGGALLIQGITDLNDSVADSKQFLFKTS